MEGLEVHIGLTPEEMMTIFNRMYLEVWNYSKEKINWEEEDITRLLLEVFEVVITAVRDGVMLTMFENNEKIYHDLLQAGIKVKRSDYSVFQQSEEDVSEEGTEETSS